ncbi:sugar ABC transporter substrate-binding protein [Oceaniglobus trochenteri]|uniref:sugar ABC transporter substrate-binding protein n=1 Tax=Oceaniglobus trochenteri TaxID=2763260 RepID=UPI001CFF8D2F|nr:sugar ABC transporter substrate-binding protein [Oceaniglobus trochenteri]
MKATTRRISALAIAVGVTASGAWAQETPKRIGYIVNYATHEWYQNVIKGMEARADELGIEVEVIDANLDIAKQVAAAEDFMARQIDVLVMTPVNEQGVVPIVRRAKADGVPLVIEGNPVPGMQTMVAICDYDTGYSAGVVAGEMLKGEGDDAPRVMNVGLPLLSATILRSQGFMDGIQTIYPEAEMVHDLDGGGNPDRAQEVSSAALAADSDIDVIYGINDSSALGGLQAWRAAGLPEDDLLVVGTGSEGLAFLNEMQTEGPFKIEAAMFPEKIGYTLVDTAVSLFQGEDLPEHVVSPTTAVTFDEVGQFYSYDGTSRQIQWDGINALPVPEACMKYASDL